MRLISFDCPCCGAKIDSDLDKKSVKCEYCDKEIVFDEEFQRVVLNPQNIRELAEEINKGTREQSSSNRTNLIDAVRKIRDSISEYQLIQSTIQQKKTKLTEKTSQRKRIASPLCKIIPWAAAVLMLFILVQMVRYSSIFILLRLLIFMLGIVVGFVTFRVIYFVLNNSVIELDAKINNLNSEILEDSNKLAALRKDNGYDILPEKYVNAGAVDYIFDVLKNQRASTIQQAINLYEDKLHQDKMEEMRREELRIQQQQLDELKDMNERSKQEKESDDLNIAGVAAAAGALAVGAAIVKKIKDEII